MNRASTLIKDLNHKGVEFFSFTLLDKNSHPIISHCNNEDWLSRYNSKYRDTLSLPPVKKYITGSFLDFIIWDKCDIDHQAKEYIETRNEVVGVSKNISMILKANQQLAVMTLGTSKDTDHLLDVISNSSQLKLFKKSIWLYFNSRGG